MVHWGSCRRGWALWWDALSRAFDAFGFDATTGDGVPPARADADIEPTSKQDSLRVLDGWDDAMSYPKVKRRSVTTNPVDSNQAQDVWTATLREVTSRVLSAGHRSVTSEV